MAGATPTEAVRMLATAYDSKWMKKKVVPKEAFPNCQSRTPTACTKVGMRKSGSAPGFTKPKADARHKMGHNWATADLGDGHRPRSACRSDSTSKGSSNDSSPETQGSMIANGFEVPFSPSGSLHSCSPLDPSRQALKARQASKARQSSKARRASKAEDHSLMLMIAKLASEKSELEEQGKDERERARARVCAQKPLALWAQGAGVPLDLAEQALAIFFEFVSNPPSAKNKVSQQAVLFGCPFDAGEDLGSMDPESFGKACCRIADVKDLSALTKGFLEKAMKTADQDDSGDIDFGEFLYFYYKFSFSEEVLVSNDERMLRAAVRAHDLPFTEVQQCKDIFDRADTNGSGEIDFDEYKVLMHKLLKIPRGSELPEKRTKDMWREATREANGQDLDFVGFVGWYKRYFMGVMAESNPYEATYNNIRRKSVC